MQISAQKPLKTLEHFAQVRKEWEEVENHFIIKDHHSIE